MGRKKSNQLPKDVFAQGSRYVFWEYLGCVNGRPVRAKQITLCSTNVPLHRVWEEYRKLTENNQRNIEWLLRAYVKSPEFNRLANKTKQMQKKVYLNKICNKQGENKNPFGQCPLEKVSPPLIKKYLLSIEGNPTRNKHKSFISSAWKWAIGEFENMPDNPFEKLTISFEENSRQEIYIPDELYEKVYHMMPPFIQAAMEISYLCRAREIEIFSLTEDDLLNTGILLRRTKKSITELTKWSNRLKAAVQLAKSTCNNKNSEFLFHDKNGSPVDPQTFSNRFRSSMRRKVQSGKLLPKERFVFHDIKAKGVSDHTQNFSGHKTLKAKKVYLRTPVKIDSTR